MEIRLSIRAVEPDLVEGEDQLGNDAVLPRSWFSYEPEVGHTYLVHVPVLSMEQGAQARDTLDKIQKGEYR